MKRTKKGFTLVELIVVIAIIGILLAVLIPTWSYFIMKANVNSQNRYSKVIFNAAQTHATRCEIVEMRADGDLFLGKDAAPDAVTGLCEKDDTMFCLYWDGKKAYKLSDTKTGDFDATKVDTSCQDEVDAFAAAINKIFTESRTTAYKVYVKNYQVQSVCSAANPTTNSVGSYPVMQDKRSDDDVTSFNMKSIVK